MPDANVIPSMTATGQYNYIDAEGGIDLATASAPAGTASKSTYSKWSGAFGDEDYFSAKYQLDISKYDPEFDLPIKVAVGVGDIFDNSGFGAAGMS